MKKPSRKKLIQEIRHHKQQCRIADMTFAPIPVSYKATMQRVVQEQFDIWWESWIAPKLDELEASLKVKERSA